MNYPNLDKTIYTQKTQSPYPTFPIKILQFGTGAFLRGFIADYVHRANEKDHFQGQIVAVGSTGSGRVDAINHQQGIFTHLLEGIVDGKTIRKNYLNTAIQQAISAATDWHSVMALAEEPELSIIISNTTEAGLSYQPDRIDAAPPTSYPGKLTAFLHRRCKFFEANPEKGVIVLPCELLTDNGVKLKELVIRQARENNLDDSFIDWIEQANTFCNTLVDRIVTGKPKGKRLEHLSNELGYKDQLLTVAEPYTFWAIEGPISLKEQLPFTEVDSTILITPDISPYRERKLRLLNGAHTISVALGYLHGLESMQDCMEDPMMKQFIDRVLKKEILPTISDTVEGASQFAQDVLDRFSNPYLDHRLLNISMQYTTKMRMRNVPTLFRYQEKFSDLPQLMCLGFAAYMYFLRPVDQHEGNYRGYRSGESYYINDDFATTFQQVWAGYDPNQTLKWVSQILGMDTLWERDLNELPGFTEAITYYLQKFDNLGVTATLKQALEKN